MNAIAEQTLISKLRVLSPAQLAEVEDFAQQALEAQLIANLASPKVKWTPEIRERLLATVESRISKRKAR